LPLGLGFGTEIGTEGWATCGSQGWTFGTEGWAACEPRGLDGVLGSCRLRAALVSHWTGVAGSSACCDKRLRGSAPKNPATFEKVDET
jgi:hypothetical protein